MFKVNKCCCLSLRSGTIVIAIMDLIFGIVGCFNEIDKYMQSDTVLNLLTIIGAIFLLIGAHVASISLILVYCL